jgi:phage-related minor tail protein
MAGGNAVELAAAYVSIVPSFEGGREKITKELVPDAEGAGREAGKKAGKGFGDSMGSMAKIGGVAAGLGVGAMVVGGFQGAIESADLQTKLAAQMSLTPEQATKAGDVSGKLYAGAYGESMADVSESVGAVMSSMEGMADASAGDLETITASALNLSAAFGTDVATSAATAGVLMKHGLAKDGTEAMDLITASMQKLPAAVREEVFPVMDEYSKHFAGLGIDGETAMGMIVAAGGDGAIGMDKMGDALKEFQIRATDMSKSTGTAYETLGLNTHEMTNRLLAGGDSAKGAMGEIVGALQSVKDPAEQSALSLALFGTPLEDLGADQIPAFLGMVDPMGDAFADTAGAAEKFGTTINSGPGVALEGLKRSAETAFMSLAEQALPVLTQVMDFAAKNEWVLGALAAVIGGALVLAFAAWAVSAWAVVAPLLANPVTWIVLAVIALIAALVLLIMNWDAVVAWVSQVWGGFVNWVGEVFAGLGAWLVQIWDGFVSWFMGVMAGFGGWISDMWNSLWQWVGSVFAGFGNWLLSIWAGISGFFMGALSAFGSWIGSIWTGISNFAMGIWNGLVSFIGGIPGAIMAGLAFLANLAATVGGWFASMAQAAIAKGMEMVNWVASIPGQILGFLGNLGSMLVNAGSNLMAGLLDGIKAGFQGIADFVGGIGQWIADHKGPKAYDLGLLVPAGGWIMGGFVESLKSHIPDLEKLMGDVTTTLKVGVPDSLTVPPIQSPVPAGGYGTAAAAPARVTNIEVNNPVPEPAGQSITNTLAKVAYLGIDGGE